MIDRRNKLCKFVSYIAPDFSNYGAFKYLYQSKVSAYQIIERQNNVSKNSIIFQRLSDVHNFQKRQIDVNNDVLYDYFITLLPTGEISTYVL